MQIVLNISTFRGHWSPRAGLDEPISARALQPGPWALELELGPGRVPWEISLVLFVLAAPPATVPCVTRRAHSLIILLGQGDGGIAHSQITVFHFGTIIRATAGRRLLEIQQPNPNTPNQGAVAKRPRRLFSALCCCSMGRLPLSTTASHNPSTHPSPP
jgi:hypothetical protein